MKSGCCESNRWNFGVLDGATAAIAEKELEGKDTGCAGAFLVELYD
jgi:hypothetical protein